MGTVSVRAMLKARLAVVSCATLAILGSASVAGCAGSSPSPSPATFSPGTGSTSAKSPAGKSPGTRSPHPRRTRSPHPRTGHSGHSPHAAPSAKSKRAHHRQRTPVAPPATGGGGTAGFQDPLLLGLGGAAILAGVGSFAYRRRTTRGR